VLQPPTGRIQRHVIPEPRIALACRVLPFGEFTVMIPDPHATVQGAVTWRNQCHNRFSPYFIFLFLF